MQEQTRKKIKDVIENNRQSIKNKKTKDALLQNPNIPKIIRSQEKLEVLMRLKRLKDYYEELFPMVMSIKSSVGDIIEETHECGTYLLLCSIFDNWKSFFLLAENGRHTAAGNVIRLIKEGTMQVHLFVVEANAGKRTHLEKWYLGDIISHGISRDVVGDYFNAIPSDFEIDMKELGAHIYQVESQVSHNAYSSVLESVSPFTEDFDFEGYAGFHRTLAWVRYAEGTLTATNIALNAVFSTLISDEKILSKVNDILIKYNPDINKGIDTDKNIEN